mmetsp:Transcript_45417/g.95320  ORF Transcript_45417/g.95320 Transcript_45417/m.95320 type:complete len:412 (-) Transcript_45417:1691-2926(-)
MHRSRLLLVKAGKSITAEASKATKDAAKAAVGASSNDNAAQIPQASAQDWKPPYPYTLLHHHKDPNLLPDRPYGSIGYTLHNFSAAASGIMSLCTSQESRDRFLSLTGPSSTEDHENSDDEYEYDGSIINTSILGQSDMGFVKVLALFHDLSNPLYDEYPEKFDIREFMTGCGWALEQFHRTKDELMPKFLNSFEDPSDPEVASDGARGVQLKTNYNFLAVAADNPDSVEWSFLSMTTPELFEAFKMNGIMSLIKGNMLGRDKAKMPPLSIVRTANEVVDEKEYYAKSDAVRLVEEDTKVMNVALLSARVEEIFPQRTMQEGGDDPDAPLEDDSLRPHRINTEQVVTQLEVLYELEQSCINDDGKKRTQTSVMVGKFEACLDGNPNRGEEGLRWRLCSYRPAVEFGYYNSW